MDYGVELLELPQPDPELSVAEIEHLSCEIMRLPLVGDGDAFSVGRAD